LQKSLEFIACLVLALFFVAPEAAVAGVVDRVAAKVNDEIITLSEVRERAEVMLGQISKIPGMAVPDDGVLVKEALKGLIHEKLQIQEATKSGIEVSDLNVTKAVEDIKRRNNLTQEVLEEMLAQEGRTLEQYKEKVIKKQIMLSQVVNFQMRNAGEVSKKQIRRHYQDNIKKYWSAPKPFVRHILFILDDLTTPEEEARKREVAREVLQEIAEGEDFVELAKEFSEDNSARDGGEIGVVERGMLVAEFENAAFSLQAGETSDLVQTKYGIHIVKVDKIVGGETTPLAEVEAEIEKKLQKKLRTKYYDSWMDELKKAAFIEISLFEDANENNMEFLEGSLETASLQEGESAEPSQAPAIQTNSEPEPTAASDMEQVEKRLNRIKKLYAAKKISKTEYERRKQSLLDQL
jgi:peptidyl-prolyl cis-trans isomerase SurA